MKILKGIASSDGISYGICYIVDRTKVPVKKYSIAPEEAQYETARLKSAVKKTAWFIEQSKNISKDSLSEENTFIFDIYLMLLKDTMLTGEAERLITDKLINAEYALDTACAGLVERFSMSENEYLRERKTDVINVVQKILRFMAGGGPDSILKVEDAEIIIAHDLSPADTSHMKKNNIKGFATDLGSKTSHTSILARSLGIPAVVGLADIAKVAQTGDFIIIDGFEGLVVINPDDETLESYKLKGNRYSDYVCELALMQGEPSVTKDGVNIMLFSNIETNDEFGKVNEYKSDGVGLYRTEYIYMEHGDVDEDTQFNILKEAAELNYGRPLTIRTFDLGSDKLSKYMPHPKEQNPAMGLRAIRYSLKYSHFFMKQLRAVLRVSAFGNVKLMFPMISGLEELRDCKNALNEAKRQLRDEGVVFNENIRVGVMMELPSLAVISEMAALEVDFFSVGTNDLIQYALGIDRNNEYVAYLYEPCHPAVRSLLKKIVSSANTAKIECTVCGEMAGEPKYIPLLIGMGYRQLSMSPSSILRARMIIRSLNVSDCEELVRDLTSCPYAKDAEDRLMEFIRNKSTDVYFH
ncbi:phosphoenolpyruvate--protein phosphotransferase [Seleniivibrio woodruffii]|uniref:Phosphoenolpyruvate-protein phosphotransferase n=1 Tax=Seleniivibrio woodruffii TaxID=1078050 RepID=A0A4R1K903_9BACT|nr:phosphoenolpyruvate--protein phosphotransferase [Seleniivibrio woodruffii]TCK60842.1 phosphoenolpyruvate--protein phosphotransferase [Seleniivibrio woodruffii]TVZ36472.1 phosphoenolpyruvate--protein phosphotransferase [Seleniivibrio woodruffii]